MQLSGAEFKKQGLLDISHVTSYGAPEDRGFWERNVA